MASKCSVGLNHGKSKSVVELIVTLLVIIS